MGLTPPTAPRLTTGSFETRESSRSPALLAAATFPRSLRSPPLPSAPPHPVPCRADSEDRSAPCADTLIRWGKGWGEGGYIRLPRESKPSCVEDTSPGSGNGCKGGPKDQKVCGAVRQHHIIGRCPDRQSVNTVCDHRVQVRDALRLVLPNRWLPRRPREPDSVSRTTDPPRRAPCSNSIVCDSRLSARDQAR
eukprot:SAG11_NODE_2245_length_3641_cov_2.290514_5_plen_193_part_00